VPAKSDYREAATTKMPTLYWPDFAQAVHP